LSEQRWHVQPWRTLMDIHGLVQHYGYVAVAVGTFLEGEAVLIMAGAAAYRGYLTLPIVILIATAASFCGDQLYFYLGRRYGQLLLQRFPSFRGHAAQATALLERYDVALILAIRFLYGLRIAGPIAMGMSQVSWIRFLVLNLIGAVVWAILFSLGGYGFGRGMAYVLGDFDSDEVWLVASFFLAGMLWYVFAHRKGTSRGKK
jgi:membrane protein DedA with SNARE-associated domain